MSSNQLDKKSQAWSALFSEPMSELVKRYTASVGFDQRLWRADIDGSLAHAAMLAAQGIIFAEGRAGTVLDLPTHAGLLLPLRDDIEPETHERPVAQQRIAQRRCAPCMRAEASRCTPGLPASDMATEGIPSR